jgi:hypothetical protein
MAWNIVHRMREAGDGWRGEASEYRAGRAGARRRTVTLRALSGRRSRCAAIDTFAEFHVLRASPPHSANMKPAHLILSVAILCLVGCARKIPPEQQIAHIVLHRVMTYAYESRDGFLPSNLGDTKAAPNEHIPAGHTLAEAIYPVRSDWRLRTSDTGDPLVVIVPAKGGAYHGFLDGRVTFVRDSKR